MRYPLSPKNKLVETIHGQKVSDDYRWLEDGDSESVRSWTEAQNMLVENSIAKDLSKKLEKELLASNNFPIVSAPLSQNGYYFWWQRNPGEEQGIVYVKKGLNGPKKQLINANELRTDKDIVSIDYWYPSPKANYMVAGYSKNGNEKSALKILNVETAEVIEEVAENAFFASVAWKSDESGFYYTKYPESGTVPKKEEHFHQKIFFHELGTSPKKDKEIFGKNMERETLLWVELSSDDRYLVISASSDWEKNNVYLYDCLLRTTKPIIEGYEASFQLTFWRNKALLYTNYKAPNGRILSSDIDNLPTDPDKWYEFVPEKKEVLAWFRITKDQVITLYMINAVMKAKRFNFDGEEIGDLPTPKYASIMNIVANRDETEFFYEYSSFTTAGVTVRYNPKTKKFEDYEKTGSNIDASDYVIKQDWFKSKDGTKVPMFIVHKKTLKLDGKNPTILYGYGGFGASETPSFIRQYIPWLERGGIYAVANIRGGGEFGRDWHLGAIRKNKQKSYDDFIAASENLINKKYTSSKHLSILGGSNGGLLVCAVAMQRPELFKAVVSLVPLTDIVRFPNFLIASRWTSEYGDPNKPKELKYILKYSPYHNVNLNKSYPAFLFTTGDNDARVDPMHARKMSAMLQSTKSRNIVLIYTDSSSGHTGSITMSRFYCDQARLLAFLIEQTA